jgi:hypothetical protein
MAKDTNTKEESFDDVENTETETVSEQSDATLADVLKALRDQDSKIEELAAENRRLRKESGEKETDDAVTTDRRPAENVTLATYEGMPIIDMRLEKNLSKDHNGNTYINNYKAICQVYGRKTPLEITYGELSEPTDYLNLPRIKFQLTNQNTADLSGASRVEHAQVITRGDKVDEIDRSSGAPIRTGKQVELVTRNDIRHYTIKVGDETVELHQDKIYR